MIQKLWQRLADWWSRHIRCPRFIEPAWTVFRLSIRYFQEDKVHRMGAALAYYTIFSLPAILVIIIGLVGFFLGEAAVQGQIYTALEQQIFKNNPEVARQIENAVRSIGTQSQNWWATMLGIGFLVFIATNIFYAMQETLNRIFRVEEVHQRVAFLRMLINRVLTFAVIMSIGGLVIISILLNTIVAQITNWVNGDGQQWIESIPERLEFLTPYLAYLSDSFLISLNLGVSLFIFGLFVVLLYKILPAVHLRWSYALWGAFWVSWLFAIGQMLLSYYLSKTGTVSAYGAAGSLIILLIWVYYSAQLFFWGAEFIRAMYEYKKEFMPAKLFAHKMRQVK